MLLRPCAVGPSSRVRRRRVATLPGASPRGRRRTTRNEKATLVLETYGHLMPDSEDRTRRALDDAWLGAITEPSEESGPADLRLGGG
jgi:hypothetical protein